MARESNTRKGTARKPVSRASSRKDGQRTSSFKKDGQRTSSFKKDGQRTFSSRKDSQRTSSFKKEGRPLRSASLSSTERPAKRTYRKAAEAPARMKAEAPVRPVRAKRTRGDFEQLRSQIEDRQAQSAARKPRAQAYIPKPRKPKAAGEEGIRLNKFIANSGICSRREADEYIQHGVITVNGQVVTELGTKVFLSDEVRLDGQLLKGEEKVYILMNKPKNCVTTTEDDHDRKTVLDLVSGKCPQRVYPVGRLDRDTTGVLLLTNDGQLTEMLTHPSYQKKKIYHVFLDSNLKAKDFDQILKGIHLEDGMIAADALSYIDGDQSQLGIEIHSGRNRIVRRIFESLGYEVIKLDRVYFAGLTKKNLRRGQWRFLTEKEVNILKMGSYE